EAKRLRVQFHSAVALWEEDGDAEDQGDGHGATGQEIADELAVRMCQYPWQESFQFLQAGDKFQILPCCYMDKADAGELAKRYGFEYREVPTVEALFTSEPFWRLRLDLAHGRLSDICGKCQAAKTYPWQPPGAKA